LYFSISSPFSTQNSKSAITTPCHFPPSIIPHGAGLASLLPHKNPRHRTNPSSSPQGHLLWNAGRTLATHLEIHASSLIATHTVLELGAGAGLPSLICALNRAARVVVTDYPDTELIENLRHNIDSVLATGTSSEQGQQRARDVIVAEGYLWGADAAPLLSHLPSPKEGFDVLILADVLFNHSEHGKLISTVQRTLRKTRSARALVWFTPYRPWLLEKDLHFFKLAREAGFEVEKELEHVMDAVMFENDRGVGLSFLALLFPWRDSDWIYNSGSFCSGFLRLFLLTSKTG